MHLAREDKKSDDMVSKIEKLLSESSSTSLLQIERFMVALIWFLNQFVNTNMDADNADSQRKTVLCVSEAILGFSNS